MMPVLILAAVLVAAFVYGVWMAGKLGVGPGFGGPGAKRSRVVDDGEDRKRA